MKIKTKDKTTAAATTITTKYAKYLHTEFTYAVYEYMCRVRTTYIYDDRRKNYSSSNKSLS